MSDRPWFMSAPWVILGRPGCPFCDDAKDLLKDHGVEPVVFNVREHPALADFLKAQGFTTVPQVFWGGTLIGGFSDLKELFDKPSEPE